MSFDILIKCATIFSFEFYSYEKYLIMFAKLQKLVFYLCNTLASKIQNFDKSGPTSMNYFTIIPNFYLVLKFVK